MYRFGIDTRFWERITIYRDHTQLALSPHSGPFQEGDTVPKVLCACRDAKYCDKLLVSFQRHPEFELCLSPIEGFAVVKQAMDVDAALVLLEVEPDLETLAIAEAFKLFIPRVPVFLIAERTWTFEKAALAIGVDAVFGKDEDLGLVIENAKAAIG
jgi:hypothetical protein